MTLHPTARIQPSADVDAAASIGARTQIWHLVQVREHAVIGADCVIGRGAYLGPGVRIGDRCKVQNHALVYEPAVVGDGVFIGPGVVFTNDEYPRAVTAAGALTTEPGALTTEPGALKTEADWTMVAVTVQDGAAIGARAVCVAPVQIGRWAMVAAGAVVTREVPDYALVAGVPARRIGWVGPAGQRLESAGDGCWVCPATGADFIEQDGALRPAAS